MVVNDVRGSQDDPNAESNRVELERRCQVPTVTAVAWKGRSFDRRVDWFGLAGGELGGPRS